MDPFVHVLEAYHPPGEEYEEVRIVQVGGPPVAYFALGVRGHLRVVLARTVVSGSAAEALAELYAELRAQGLR